MVLILVLREDANPFFFVFPRIVRVADLKNKAPGENKGHGALLGGVSDAH